MKKVMLSAAVCAMAFSVNAKDVEEAAVCTSAFNSIYAGLGIGGSFLKTDGSYKNDKGEEKKFKANRFMGSFVLGAGKVFNNRVYLGGEFLADFMKNKKWEDASNGDNWQSKGFIPQIDAKIGYAFKNDSLIYGKLGCAWSKISEYDKSEDKSDSKTKAAFVLGLGAEKAFCKKFSVALEGDYNFGWKWDDARCNKGWSVRALVKYNVKY